MIAALLCAAVVVLIGARLQPSPPCRRAELADTASPGFGRRGMPCVPRILGKQRRARATSPAEAAAWCDRLARAVRSGSTLTAAIRAVDPPPGGAPDIERVVLSLDRGTSLKEALDGGRCSSPHLELAFVVLRACALHGGPASEPIDRAAATLRARDADDADRRTQSAQAKLSAVVMTILPGAMLATMLVTSDATRVIMLSPIGLIIVVIGGGLNVIGWHWMRRMIDGDTA